MQHFIHCCNLFKYRYLNRCFFGYRIRQIRILNTSVRRVFESKSNHFYLFTLKSKYFLLFCVYEQNKIYTYIY